MKEKIKTIDLEVREWFDKTYGNTYFSAHCILNYGLKSQRTIVLPFQYGYGSYAEDMAFSAIKRKVNKAIFKNLLPCYSLWHICRVHNIILRTNYANYLKREVIAFGVKAA